MIPPEGQRNTTVRDDFGEVFFNHFDCLLQVVQVNVDVSDVSHLQTFVRSSTFDQKNVSGFWSSVVFLNCLANREIRDTCIRGD